MQYQLCLKLFNVAITVVSSNRYITAGAPADMVDLLNQQIQTNI